MDALQVEIAPINSADEVFAAPLSFAQRRLWFLNQLEPNSAAYNISAVVRIKGTLDVRALEQSVNEIIRRHETLRTSFVMTGERVLQVISPELSLKFEHFDLSDAADKDEQVRQLTREAAQKPFDLEQLPLLTARLLRLDAAEHVLVLVMDHIISDGWSLGLLINEITVLYRAYSAGESSPLPELEIQYVDYAEWQREWLSGEKLSSELDYWKRKLAGQAPLLELPADRPAPPTQSDRGATEVITLPVQLATELKDLSRRQGATLFMTLLAAFQALLWRYTDQADFAVGTPVAGRTQPETENLIGCFVNTLVLRADVAGNPTFLDLLKRVRQTTLEAHAHQDVPFELLVEQLQPERSMSHAPFFQVMLVLHPPLPAIELPGLTIKQIDVESETAKFDLIFSFREEGNELTGILEYRTERFDRSTIQRMGVHFQQLLEGIVADPSQRISSLPLLIDSERQQLLEHWNQTTTAYPRERCVQELFEEQVERDPQAVAVVFADQEVTYGELNRRANQLAHYLRELGVGPEVVVGLCVERSVEMVVGLLGILKAGGAYLPMDPQNPLERSQFMLEDAGVPVLLTQQHLLSSLPSHWSQVISLDDDLELISQHSDSNPPAAVSPENLAYVMYTSGSTGTPKGVSVTQRSVVRLVKETDYARFEANEVFLQMAPLSFDASTFELWGSLLNGAKLVVMPPQQATLAELGEVLAQHQVTTLWLTAGLFHLAVDEGVELTGVRQLLAGGDALNVKQVKQVLASLSEGQRLIDGYGPTEGTTFSCCHVMDRHTEINSTVPIGRPVANTEAYVLDRMQQPAPVGVAGELYLGGDGLARGYLNQPELTAEKFVPHPFSTGERLYRTGDRVRYLASGELEFLGRFDHQLKLRGFRIELGEIETTLTEHSGVQEAVVVAQADGVEKRLVAYVVLQPEQSPSATDLRMYLLRRLPEYMVPAGIMMIDELPLTANGKVDRRALPALTMEGSEAEFLAPRTPIEEMLAALWVEVLGVERVGATDDFFELGGHSLLATQLLSRVRDTFQVDVPLRHIFEQPRLTDFATVLQTALTGASAPAQAIVPVSREQVLPLSFAQQRLWFIDRLIPGSALYNISMAVRLSGQLDVRALEQTLSEVVRRHEILRTTFTLENDIPVQVVHAHEALQLLTLDATEAQLDQIIEEQAQRPFDLTNGPLLRAMLVKVSEQEHVAVFTMHHIITDGWSMGVLVNEVKALYEAFVEGNPSPLPELAIQYADFAAWEQLLGTSRFEKDLAYWRRQLEDAPVLELPVDRPRSALAAHHGSTERFRLSESLTAALKELSRREGTTLFMTLLAAWNVLLARYSGQENICVGTPIANRNRMDTESLIGFFVNTLVMRLNLSGNPRFSDLLAQARTVCLNGYAHQDMPFEKLVEEITLERNLRHSPLFQVMLTLQNAPMQALELPGLKLALLEVPIHSAKFDLLLNFQESENCLDGALDYDTELLDRSTIQRMDQHLQNLLEGVVNDPNTRLFELPLLTDAERQSLKDWNQTATAYPRERCVHELFEEQVERDPQAVAVIFGDQKVTYGELNRRANQLAHYLQELGVGPETAVGIGVERSIEMVVGLLGILKAGGAYLPLDPHNPRERSQFMLEDAGVPVLLVQQHLRASLPEWPRTISLDADWESIAGYSDSNPEVPVSPENLVYVMYTSGSTGMPKGVTVPHRGVVRLVKETNYARFEADEVFIQFAPLSFDVSTFELWGGLLNGAKVVVMPPQQATFAELGETLARHEVTTLWLTAGMFHLAVDEGMEFSGVRQLLAGGDALSVKHVKQVLAGLREGQRLIDGYGPTEVTTFSCCYVMDQHTEIGSTVPIGRPISNTEAYVLDRMQQPVPVGVAGELCLGGDGVARGYLNRPELTAAKFVPHPFSREGGARLYRTGDRVRYLASGELEFLGRFDHQVKLRGFRIELGEIETTLTAHSGVQEAVVVAQVAGVEKRLVAYVVLQPEQPPTVSDLRMYLQRHLPEYMAPAGIMVIDEIPLTPNGKVNRRALPALTFEETETEFVAPRTPIEEMLAELWCEVLRVERVSATDDFFELGGHSLLATQLQSRVRSRFQVDVPLRHIFEQPRLSDFATLLQAALSGANDALIPAISRVSLDQVPLSFAQQRLWFIDRLIPGSALYNTSIAVRLSGQLDVRALEQTLSEVVRRHEILRTTFTLDNDVPVQVVHPHEYLQLVTIDTTEAQLQEIIEAETQRPFDLSHGPLLRALLVKVSQQEHVAVFTMHHIITDGWSMGVLVNEVKALYEAFVEGTPSPLPELAIQYADFAAWEQSLGTSRFEKDLAYWRRQLEDAPVLELPVDRPRSALAAHHGSTERFRLSESLTAALKELSRREGTTLFMTLLAVWNILLARYSGQEDICVGTPIANRNRMDTESLIGFFVNTLVMRLNLSGNPRFSDLLAQARTVCLNGYAHQDMPFEKLVEEITLERNLRHSPLFQVMLTLQNAPMQALELPGLKLALLEVPIHSAKFDLLLNFQESENCLEGALDYDTDLFDRSTIQRMVEHLQTLLEGVVNDPAARLFELPLLTDAERQSLKDWNQTATAYPRERCVHELFEEQVERDPQAVAVVFGNEEISYRELNRRANQLAHYLLELGVGPETIVGLCVERATEMVVGLLGILKAGGAYVPLDPSHPQQRLSFTLSDTEAPVLLTQSSLTAALPVHGARVLCLDTEWETISGESEENPAVAVGPDNLAYVIYTSGSTGQPKGVQITHGAFSNHMLWMRDEIPLTAADRLLQKTPFTFDASIWEFFLPLMCGAQLVLARPGGHQDSAYLVKTVMEKEITVLQVVPTMLRVLLSEKDFPGCRSLRRVFCGGEAVTIDLPERFFTLFTETELYNLYGPTETAIQVTCWHCERQSEDGIVPIGRPIPNVQFYVLDALLQPVPIGVSGELYIGGASLSRGYLKRPDLTAERFIPHSFSETPGARLYRTGDLVRYRDDGRVEYLGRNDSQVKLRGFRIEFGEIESALGQHESVQACVVVVREDTAGEQRLAAYVIAREGHAIETAELRHYLSERLPVYMTPTVFVRLEALPLLSNGKVDRKALPAPEGMTAAAEFIAPRNPIEEMLSALWTEVLGVERVGAADDFFELGGHSLLATRLLSRVRDAFQVEVPLRHIFEHSSLAELATVVEAALSGGNVAVGPAIATVSRDQVLPLSFAQQRLWFIEQLEPTAAAYHISQAIRLTGRLNIEALRNTFNEIVRRHEILRTVFVVNNGDPAQLIIPSLTVELPVVDLSALPENERKTAATNECNTDAQLPFDLEHGPLFRLKLVQLGDDDYVLIVTMHHIITDGWSFGVLVRELTTLYRAFITNSPSPLPELPIQYADFAYWQRYWSQDEVNESELEYWHRQLAGPLPVLALPADRKRPPQLSYRGGSVSFALSPDLTHRLNRLSHSHRSTLFMTLLAAFQTLLYRHTGQEDIIVGTPIANRQRVELENLIGFFVNTLAIRADLSGEPAFSELLARVREAALGAYAHQRTPFERLVQELQPDRDLSYSPIFQVLFALQNAATDRLDFPELSLTPQEFSGNATRFELECLMWEQEDQLHGLMVYSEDLFDEATIRGMLANFEVLLEAVANAPDERINALPLLSQEKQHQLLVDWNDTASVFPRERCIHQLVAEQAEKTPGGEALVSGVDRLSYRELNRRANQLASYLKRLGVGADSRVGVMMDRSTEMLISVLGTLKAGGAYLPLDPEYPRERVLFMLEDARAQVLLTQRHLLERLPETAAQVVCLEDHAEAISRESDANPVEDVNPDNLAYVIYTSGSTGTPKAVAMPHRALVNMIQWQLDHSSKAPRTLQFASLSFDVSFQETFSTWCSGGALVVVGEETRRDSQQLLRTLIDERIERLFMPYVALQYLAQAAEAKNEIPATLRQVITAGEQLKITPAIRSFLGKLEHATLDNHYGPSETHLTTTLSLTGPFSEWPELPAIGRPISNTQCYVLDARMQPVPLGVVGELYLGGDCLARGYLHRPDVTASRFVPNPFATQGGARLYRTGDLVRYQADGNLQFLGRGDQQVKVRGYRIELGEIEVMLRRHPLVREAIVTAHEVKAGGKALAAYVLPHENAELAAADLRQHLTQHVPEYMTPASYIFLSQLPLTPSGKINRRALPKPDLTFAAREVYVAPRTPAEELLASLWADVLGVEGVGINDNFFDLGGHSLVATRLMSRVREAFRVELPLRSLFITPTVAGLVATIEKERDSGRDDTTPPLLPVSREEALSLSFAQERMWFLNQLDPDSPTYNMSTAIRLRGSLNQRALEESFNALVRRHEALRTTFRHVNGGVVQVIAPALTVPLDLIDLSSLPAAEQEDETHRLLRTGSREPFNLAEGPLLRARLFQLNDHDHLLLLTMHHIVSDGWSMNILVRELTALYSAFVNDVPPALPELPIQYADFAVWQKSWLTGEVFDRQLTYWRRQLQQPLPLLELPADRRRPPVQTYNGAQHRLALSPETSQRLKDLSRQNGVTAFMTLLAAFKVLLLRHTGQEDVIVGTPVAGRNRTEVEGLIGFLVNTLVLRTSLAGNPTFRELLHRVREVTLEAYQHQDLPFERLVDALQVPRDPSHTPLFQVMFAFQNLLPDQINVQGLDISGMDLPDETAKFDLVLVASERGEQTIGTIVYNTDLFEPATIERLANHFVTLVETVAAEPSLRLSELGLLTGAERQQLIELGRNLREYPRDASIAEVFEQQVELTPDAVAVEFQDTRLTYRQLNERANQLARHLMKLGVTPDSLVGLCIERSVDLIAAVIGILKAGGAYLPLDPSYPRERLSAMFEEAQPGILLTQQSLLSELPPNTARVVFIDSDAERIALESIENPDSSDLSSDNLAYVMYTSGSTGTPKGVSITHRNIIRLCRNTDWAPLDGDQTFLQIGPMSFDASTLEIFPSLLNGARLVVMPPQLPTLEELATVITQRRITILWLTAGLFHQMADYHPGALGSLRYLMSGGDVLSPEHVRRVLQTSSTMLFINGYGPTECTVFTSTQTMSNPNEVGDPVSIGKPIANTEVYLMDQHLQPVPLGASGELCIGGDGVGRGYFNRPDLTADRFVPNPFSSEPGARLYRSGDMARYQNDGRLEFQGRRDYQVKVRGFRIELGDIEVACAQHPAVKEALVIAHGQTAEDKRLVAYLVTDTSISRSELRGFLKDKLPDFMVPSVFVILDEFPLTPNGKIDRRALPLPGDSEEETPEDLSPRTPVEDMLANIWADVLDQKTVGLHDDFFELGGHSLLATQVITRIRGAFQIELPLRELFINPTVAALAQVIDNALKESQGVDGPPLEKVPRDRDLPLSFAQQRLWFIDQFEPNNAAYNLPVAVRLKGALDVPALKQSLTEVVRRHEVLRTLFKLDPGGPVQYALPPTELPVPIIDLTALDPETREIETRQLCLREVKRPFDLAKGPLVRAGLIKLADDEYVLQLVMHHIVGDAWSLEIFLREVIQLYQAFRAEEPSPLAELAVQYADYAYWQREWLQGESFAKLLAYWKPRLEGAPALLELPADRPRPAVQSSRGDRHTFTIGPELTKALQKLSRREGATIFMTLLAAFQTLLSRYTGVEDIVVGADVNNRTRLETEGLIGFFINMLVLRTDLSGNPTFKELLGRVRQTALGAYAHQEMPLEKLVEELQPQRNLSYSPLFQVVFNFNNRSTQPPQLPDLQLSPVPLDFTEVKFDLSLFMWDGPEILTGMWTYSTDLFEADRIHRMHEHFVTLLQSIVDQPEQRLNALEYLTEAERDAQTAAKRKLKQANFQKFKGLRPQAIKHSRVNLVQAEMLSPGEPLPLVIRPDVEDVDLAAWAGDNLQFIETQLSKHGALLFRDFGVSSLPEFRKFTTAVSPELLDYSEPSSPRTHLQDRIYTSTEYPADQWIQLHNEMSYTHTWPRRVFFFCDQPAEQGGETPIAFSRKVFELLDPKIRERFMQHKVMYVRNFGDGLDLPWQHVFHTGDKAAVAAYCRASNVDFEWNNGRLTTRQVRQAVIKHPESGETVWFNQAHAFHASTLNAEVREFLLSEKTEDEFPRNAYYGDGSPIESSVIAEIREAYRQAAVMFPWKRSDILMLDNMRVAHGRAPFAGPRKILVAMSGSVSNLDVDTNGDLT